MIRNIYPVELQLNKVNTSVTEVSFLDLHLFISNDIVSTKNYDKRDYSNFEILQQTACLVVNPISSLIKRWRVGPQIL